VACVLNTEHDLVAAEGYEPSTSASHDTAFASAVRDSELAQRIYSFDHWPSFGPAVLCEFFQHFLHLSACILFLLSLWVSVLVLRHWLICVPELFCFFWFCFPVFTVDLLGRG
jgi:hypothetical protein